MTRQPHRLAVCRALPVGLLVAILLLTLVAWPATASLVPPPPDRGDWVTIEHLAEPRSDHTATLLEDGSVLVAGGRRGRNPALALELVYPERAASRTAGVLPFALSDHDAVALPDGRVLLVGGDGLGDRCAPDPPLLWDPGTLAVEPVAGIPDAWGSSATLLEDGRVLIAGGRSECTWKADNGLLLLDGRGGFAESVVWDPADGVVEATDSLDKGRWGHFAVRLSDGRVLVIGGVRSSTYSAGGSSGAIGAIEAWDPTTGSWSTIGRNRISITDAALLADGRVVVAGSFANEPALATIDPDTGEVTPVEGGPKARRGASLVILPEGRVMLVGGVVMDERRDRPQKQAPIWDPTTGSWSQVKYPKDGAHEGQAATVTSDGIVLVIRGRDVHGGKTRTIGWVEAWRR